MYSSGSRGRGPFATAVDSTTLKGRAVRALRLAFLFSSLAFPAAACGGDPDAGEEAADDGAGACAAGFADCDGDSRNGCETAITTPSDCGGCGVACPLSSLCREGSCTSDTGSHGGAAAESGGGDVASGDGDEGATGESSDALVIQPPSSAHPRLWVRPGDVGRLRSWANAQNPVFVELQKIADVVFIKNDLDNPATTGASAGVRTVKQDQGSDSYQNDPTSEEYARMLAFLSVVTTDPAKKASYAKRAHDLIMKVIKGAAACQLPVIKSNAVPYCSSKFAIFDRASFWGDAYATVLDWAYPQFTAADKALIRKVFLRWADELTHAMTTSNNHPEPVGVYNSPVLTEQNRLVRWAANNYFAAHMKNLGLLALALDPADDPPVNPALPAAALGNTVRSYLQVAVGAYLYMTDYAYRYGGYQADPANPGQGFRGSAPEGSLYGPEAMGFAAQLYLALHTSGLDDPSLLGPQASWANHPHWDKVGEAFLHSLEPSPSFGPHYVGIGPYHQMAAYGEVNYETLIPDPMSLFGPRGIWAYNTGHAAELNLLRFLEKEGPAGGAPLFLTRIAKTPNVSATLNAIFAFMLYDPTAAAPPITDPRPGMPLVYDSPGLGRVFGRTSWTKDASWLAYKLGWTAIDHQLSEGNQVELYRKGQWLTKGLAGYGPEVGLAHHHNTMAVENNLPFDIYKGNLTPAGGVTYTAYQVGSQWPYGVSGDPAVVRKSLDHPGFIHVTGDSTNLYNLKLGNLSASDVAHVSRSLVWLEPDHVVVYDRATSKTAGRFKRFWLTTQNLATLAQGSSGVSSGSLADLGPAGTPIRKFSGVVPAGGFVSTALVHPLAPKAAGVPMPEQKLLVTTMLPSSITVVASAHENLGSQPLGDDPMKFALKIEATGGPKDARFLNVLQGADAGAAADPVALVQANQVDATKSPYEGVRVKNTVILFARRLGEGFTGMTYSAPAGAKHIITGLPPSTGFTVSAGANTVTITPGGSKLSDSGGVLTF